MVLHLIVRLWLCSESSIVRLANQRPQSVVPDGRGVVEVWTDVRLAWNVGRDWSCSARAAHGAVLQLGCQGKLVQHDWSLLPFEACSMPPLREYAQLNFNRLRLMRLRL